MEPAGPGNQSDKPLWTLTDPIHANDSRVASDCPSATAAFFKSSELSTQSNRRLKSSISPAPFKQDHPQRYQRTDFTPGDHCVDFRVAEMTALDDSLRRRVARWFFTRTAVCEEHDTMRR